MTRRFTLAALTAVSVLSGIWSVQPTVYAKGDCDFGCCEFTTDCGSPFFWRCCEPRPQEADCGPEPCYNYCFEQTSCPPA